jgi:hypothetical protein
MFLPLFRNSRPRDFLQFKLTIGIMYTNVVGTEDVLRLI